MSIFTKLFGKRQDGSDRTGRHRSRRPAQGTAEPANGGERPLFRDQVAVPSADSPVTTGPVSVDPVTAGRIGFEGQESSGSAGGLNLPVCARCGNRVSQESRFCSNCGAPLLRGGAPSAERASETTSTISISGLEAYEAEATGQTPLLSPELQASIDALPLGSALLVVRRGPNSGSRFLLDADVTTAGRHPLSDIFLDDVTVSRRHVEFHRGADGRFTVSDVGSLNGTYVNRQRIDSAPLANGDEVQIGKFRLVFLASQRSI